MERRTYDHLVIGAGSAGCVVAARLAQAGRRVALIEAGPLEEQNEDILNLGRWPELIGGPLDYDFAIEPQPRGNSAFRHPRGRVLGGTGSLNTCIAFIPADGDFQRWVAAGGVGWSAAEVAPHYERVLATLGLELADLDNPLSAAFVSAAEAAGLPRVDFAGAKMQPGVGPAPFNRQGDRRRSTAIAYLLPLSRWSGGAHLHILPERPVLRLLFEGDRAIGVATHAGEIFAEGAIILCAGAFHTPQLLLLSGIGPADELHAQGIRPYLDLPGVGENLQDHPETTIGWQTKRPPPPNAIRVWEVVLFAGEVGTRQIPGGRVLADLIVRQGGRWVFQVPAGVESAHVFGCLFHHALVIHVVEEVGDRLFALIDELDARAVAEGHREEAVVGGREGPFGAAAFPEDHIQRQGNKMAAGGVPDAEEIAIGDAHAGVFLTIPMHFEHQFAQVLRGVAAGGHPDVTDATRAFDIGQHVRLARRYYSEIAVGAASIPAGGAPRAHIPLHKRQAR